MQERFDRLFPSHSSISKRTCFGRDSKILLHGSNAGLSGLGVDATMSPCSGSSTAAATRRFRF